MTGTTTRGLVYPLPSEPVRDGAARIQVLAEQLDQDPVELVASRDSSFTVPNQSWVLMNGFSGSSYQHGGSAQIGVTASGVQIRRTGRYFIEAEWEHPDANAAGHLAIGVDLNTVTPPTMMTAFAATLKATGWQQVIRVQGTRTLTGGTILSLFCFQSSGAAVGGSKFRLGVRQLSPGQAHG